ncbi:MAG: hypothetical protein WCX81_04860 [Monoglobales bacterium]
MSKVRGFEVCSKFINDGINLPKRSTKNSAGYDIESAEDIVIPSIWNSKDKKPTFVKTGIKAYMLDDEVLYLYNRSSNPGKKGLVLSNSVGVVDSDYYNNPDNEGHIMFAFYNVSAEDAVIKKGDRIGQGVFAKFLKADGDSTTAERMGGFGSTNK